MLPALVLLFVLMPIVELAVILQVGQLVGFWPTLGALVATSLIGSVLLRAQGRAAWRRFNEALRRGRPPARETLDGAMIIFGGALLLTPGFVTDAVGLAFLAPPSRAVLRALLVRRFTALMIIAGRRPRRRRAHDVEGRADEIDPGRTP